MAVLTFLRKLRIKMLNKDEAADISSCDYLPQPILRIRVNLDLTPVRGCRTVVNRVDGQLNALRF